MLWWPHETREERFRFVNWQSVPLTINPLLCDHCWKSSGRLLHRKREIPHGGKPAGLPRSTISQSTEGISLPSPSASPSFSSSRGSREGRLSWWKSEKEAEVSGSHRQILSISPVAYLRPLAFSFYPPILLSSVQPSPSIFFCSSSFPCSLPLSYFHAPSFSPPSRGTLIMVLFTAARFSVKTGRTRSKGYQVWRSGRPEREAQPKKKMEEERGGRLTRDRVTISTKER